METVLVKDDGGDTIPCISHNGHLFPCFPDTRGIARLSSIKVRPDDVILCSYPKSGTHWLYEITSLLLTGKPTEEGSMKTSFLEFQGGEELENLPSPRFMGTHCTPDLLPKAIFSQQNKIILIVRNPKDVAVSYYNFLKKVPFVNYKGKWENFIKPYLLGTFFYGSWFDYHLAWHKQQKSSPDLPIFVTSYESMRENQLNELKKMSKFLGLDRDEDFLMNVVKQSTFNKMKETSEDRNVFRKGQVGDWKNWFTVAQNELFDAYYKEHVKDIPFDIRFTLPTEGSQ